MKVLKGKKVESIHRDVLKAICGSYNKTILDLGTGDGTFPYRRASKNTGEFYIGLDSAAENMMESAFKSGRKPTKGGLNNVLFAVGDALNLTEELTNSIDHVFINLPWGSLRDAVVKGEEELLHGIRRIARRGAAIDIYVTYSSLYEANEIHSRDLPELSLEYINTTLKHRYRCCGIEIQDVRLCTNEDLKSLDTRWAKKLAFGRERNIYHLSGVILQESN